MRPYWPLEEPQDDDLELGIEPLGLRIMTDVNRAYPSSVSPDPEKSPEKYWDNKECRLPNNGDPWVRLAQNLFFHGARGFRAYPRDAEKAQDAWNWADATLRCWDLKHEEKEVVVAWILESFFSMYWFDHHEPSWVEKVFSSEE